MTITKKQKMQAGKRPNESPPVGASLPKRSSVLVDTDYDARILNGPPAGYYSSLRDHVRFACTPLSPTTLTTSLWYVLRVAQELYILPCPKCEQDCLSLFFTDTDGINDEHGYISCATCVEFFVRESRVPIVHWVKVASVKDYRKYPCESWLPSHWRSLCLVRRAAARQAKKYVSKKKKKRTKTVKPKAKKSGSRHHASQSESASSVSVGAEAPAPVLTDEVWLKYSPSLIAIVKAQCALTATKHGISMDVANKVTSELTPETLRPHAHMS